MSSVEETENRTEDLQITHSLAKVLRFAEDACGLTRTRATGWLAPQLCRHSLAAGDFPVPCGWVLECEGAQHVLHVMWMVCPDQAGSPQGSQSVSCDVLAANDLGIGSGWQQSKQN